MAVQKKAPADGSIRFREIIKAEWEGDDGRKTFSLFGLDDDGRFYRYVPGQRGWRLESGKEEE